VLAILGCYLQDILVNGYSKLNRKITYISDTYISDNNIAKSI